jgi:lipoyl synthase
MAVPNVSQASITGQRSPEIVRLSLAAAMTLGFVRGWFYRNARLGCINLLLTYPEGCKARCAFCGITGEKERLAKGGNFIRVPWKAFPTADVIDAIRNAPEWVHRVCVSMISDPRCREDVLTLTREVVKKTDKAVSLLISPSVMLRDDLAAMKDAGAERVGVAIDAATEDIFNRLRGKGVRGPHRWDRYWRIYEQSLEVFGEGMSGVHLICGLGETERELVTAMERARTMGGSTHLFSFFPEPGSAMEQQSAPPMGTYRRIQLARWLIDHGRSRQAQMSFDDQGRIVDFALSAEEIEQVVALGEPFETSGCPGRDGKVACNRPYGNEKPGPCIRNFPFPPDAEDLEQVCRELVSCDECAGECAK